MDTEDLETRYGFAQNFSKLPTSNLLAIAKAEKSRRGSGQARMYFMLALKSEIEKRGESYPK